MNAQIFPILQRHYYQPMFTLIGGGMKRLEHSYKQMGDVLPQKAKWLQGKAVEFQPASNTVTTSRGNTIHYDILLIATGLQLNYNKVEGSSKSTSCLHIPLFPPIRYLACWMHWPRPRAMCAPFMRHNIRSMSTIACVTYVRAMRSLPIPIRQSSAREHLKRLST